MVFKAKKIPKHLIIQEEYEIRPRSRFGLSRIVVLSCLMIGLAYVISIGITQI